MPCYSQRHLSFCVSRARFDSVSALIGGFVWGRWLPRRALSGPLHAASEPPRISHFRSTAEVCVCSVFGAQNPLGFGASFWGRRSAAYLCVRLPGPSALSEASAGEDELTAMAPRGSSRSPERRRRRSPTPRRRKRCRSLPSESREGRRRGSRGSGRRSSRSASSSPRDRSGRGGGRRLTGRREDHPNTRSGGGSGGRRSSRRRPSSSRDLSRESHASLPPRSGRRPAVGGGHHRSTHHSRKDSPPPSSRRRRGGSSSSVSRNGASLGGRAGARGRTGGGSFAARRGTPSNSSREDRRRPLGRRRSSISESPPHRRRGGGGPFPGSGRPASPRLMRQNAMVGFPPFLRRPGEGGSGGGGPHGFYAREGGALPPVSYGRRGEGSLLPPLPPTAGSGLVPSRHPTGGPSPGGGGLSSLVHPLDPRSSNSGGGAGAGPWRGRGGSPPPEFFLARKRAKVGLAKAEEMRRQRRELRRSESESLQTGHLRRRTGSVFGNPHPSMATRCSFDVCVGLPVDAFV